MSEMSNEPVYYDAVEKRKHELGWGKFILFFLTYIGFQTVLSIIGFTVYIFVKSPIITLDNLDQVIMEFASNPWMLYLDFFGFLLTILIFKSSREFLKGAFSFAPMKKVSTYLYLIGAFIFMYVSQYLILDVFKLETATDTVDTFGFSRMTFDWLTISILMMGMAIITPIKEEILFRGVLHGFIDKKWNFWLGLLISSAIFGVLHLGYPISAGIMGIAFVVLYKLTRSLVTPIILHMVWNAFAVVTMIMYVNG